MNSYDLPPVLPGEELWRYLQRLYDMEPRLSDRDQLPRLAARRFLEDAGRRFVHADEVIFSREDRRRVERFTRQYLRRFTLRRP